MEIIHGSICPMSHMSPSPSNRCKQKAQSLVGRLQGNDPLAPPAQFPHPEPKNREAEMSAQKWADVALSALCVGGIK